MAPLSADQLFEMLGARTEELDRLKRGLAYMRPEVRAFALRMEIELRKNDHKPGWKGETPEWLAGRARDEAHELALAVRHGDDVGAEAADMANMAMMVADVSGALPPPDHDLSPEDMAAILSELEQ